MYILTDYRLILTKDRLDLSSERADPSETALARPAATVNTDSFSRQRGRHKITNLQLSKENFKEKEKLVTGTWTDWPTDRWS
jgi:hypothetical protein